jgi:hypothetical protein
MRKLLASVGIAALLAVGLFVDKSVTSPAPAYAACNTMYYQGQRSLTQSVYDETTGAYTNIVYSLTKYEDHGACVLYYSDVYSQDATPIGNRTAVARAWVNGTYFGSAGGCNTQNLSWFCQTVLVVYTGYQSGTQADNYQSFQSSTNFNPSSTARYVNGI